MVPVRWVSGTCTGDLFTAFVAALTTDMYACDPQHLDKINSLRRADQRLNDGFCAIY